MNETPGYNPEQEKEKSRRKYILSLWKEQEESEFRDSKNGQVLFTLKQIRGEIKSLASLSASPAKQKRIEELSSQIQIKIQSLDALIATEKIDIQDAVEMDNLPEFSSKNPAWQQRYKQAVHPLSREKQAWRYLLDEISSLSSQEKNEETKSDFDIYEETVAGYLQEADNLINLTIDYTNVTFVFNEVQKIDLISLSQKLKESFDFATQHLSPLNKEKFKAAHVDPINEKIQQLEIKKGLIYQKIIDTIKLSTIVSPEQLKIALNFSLLKNLESGFAQQIKEPLVEALYTFFLNYLDGQAFLSNLAALASSPASNFINNPVNVIADLTVSVKSKAISFGFHDITDEQVEKIVDIVREKNNSEIKKIDIKNEGLDFEGLESQVSVLQNYINVEVPAILSKGYGVSGTDLISKKIKSVLQIIIPQLDRFAELAEKTEENIKRKLSTITKIAERATEIARTYEEEVAHLSGFEKDIFNAHGVADLLDTTFFTEVSMTQWNLLKARLKFLKEEVIAVDYHSRSAAELSAGRVAEANAIDSSYQKAVQLFDNFLDLVGYGIYHSSLIDHTHGTDYDHKLAKKIAAGKGETKSSDAETANKGLSQCELFHSSSDDFEWATTQRNKAGSAEQVGALQEIISFLYTEHIGKRGDRFSGTQLIQAKEQGGTVTIEKLLHEIIGDSLSEFLAKVSTSTDPRLVAASLELKNHTEDSFQVFRRMIKFKIARDDLSTLAVFDFAANNDDSLPGGTIVDTSGRIAAAIRYLSSAQTKSGNGNLALVATTHNISEVLKKIKPEVRLSPVTEAGNPILPGDPNGLLYDNKFRFIRKAKRRALVDFPQLERLLPQLEYKQREWWQCGIPFPSYAMNQSKSSLKIWLEAEGAMRDMQTLAVTGKFGDLGELQKKLNTNGSIINGYTAFESNNPTSWWQNRGSTEPSGISYVDQEFLSLYMYIMTIALLQTPGKRTTGRFGSQEIYEKRHNAIKQQLITGLSAGKTLNAKMYAPIVRSFLENNDFMMEKEDAQAFYSLLQQRSVKYWEWLSLNWDRNESQLNELHETGNFLTRAFIGGINKHQVLERQHSYPEPVVIVNPEKPF